MKHIHVGLSHILSSGDPQSSILGPILFFIHIDDFKLFIDNQVQTSIQTTRILSVSTDSSEIQTNPEIAYFVFSNSTCCNQHARSHK